MALYNGGFCLFSSSTVPFSKFEISRSSAQNYEGLYLISNDGQYLASNSSGQTYVSNTVNADCYWSFMKNEKRDADLYYFYYPDSSRSSGYYDTSASKDSFTSAMSTLGYFDYALKNLPASEAYSYLSTTDDVFIFRGHGTAGRIAFKDQAGNSNGRIVCSTRYTDTSCYDISALSESALSSVRCVLYIGCNTGASYNNANLVDETYAKGAHFVLGTTQTIKTSDNGEWLNLFLEELEDGDNIRQALYDATDRKGTTTITVNGTSVEYVGYPYYCKGDQAQYLQ